jgi:triphosphatase
MLHPCIANGYEHMGTPRFAKAVKIKKHWSTCRAMRVIMRASLTHIEANLEGAIANQDPEFVHQLRLGLRRMRSAIRIFQPTDLKSVVIDLQWVEKLLGECRDYQIFVTRVLPPICDSFSNVRISKRVADYALREINLRVELVRSALSSERLAQALIAINEWLATTVQWIYVGPCGTRKSRNLCKQSTSKVFRYASKEISRAYRRIGSVKQNVGKISATARHRIRINEKRLRVSLEFFASLYEKNKVSSSIKCLEAIQDQLGRANDFEVAKQLMRNLGAPVAFIDFAERWLEARIGESLVDIDLNFLAAKRLTRFWH